jgi:hypothetical protein
VEGITELSSAALQETPLPPPVLQRGFAGGENRNLITVYHKLRRHYIQTSLKNVGLEAHYFSAERPGGGFDSVTCEKWLAEAIEAPANPILEKIRCYVQIGEHG